MLQNKNRSVIAATSVLATLAYGQQPAPELVDSVKFLAISRVTLDACLTSPDFKKLALSTQRQTIAVSNKIDHLANDMHESSRSKLLYISYKIAVSNYTNSADFRRQLLDRKGGACDYKSIADLDPKLKRAAGALNKQL